MGDKLIVTRGLTRAFIRGNRKSVILKDIALEVNRGEFVAIMGPSGSGKSTLMHILGCIDRQTSGDYLLDGKNIRSIADDDLACIRSEYIGFVFQDYHLLPGMSAVQNVTLGLKYSKSCLRKNREQCACDALMRVGLDDSLFSHRPTLLSGGQCQRVAIARAIAKCPPLLLADEPTGSLDSISSTSILNVLSSLHEQGMTIVLITHDYEVAKRADRILILEDGVLR